MTDDKISAHVWRISVVVVIGSILSSPPGHTWPPVALYRLE